MNALLAAGLQVVKTTHPKAAPTPLPTPDHMLNAALELNRDTWDLVLVGGAAFVAATASAAILLIQYWAQIREQRLKRAMDLLDEWYESVGDLPSPCKSLSSVSHEDYNYYKSQLQVAHTVEENETLRQQMDEQGLRFAAVHDFFERAAYLYKRNLIDRTYFLNRHWHLVEASYAVLTPWYNDFPSRSKEPLGIEYLLPHALNYEKKLLRPASAAPARTSGQ